MKTGEFLYLCLVMSAYVGFALALFASTALTVRNRERRSAAPPRPPRPEETRTSATPGWKSQTSSLR